jgi:hypothetical protein
LIRLAGRLVPALILSGLPLSRRAQAQEAVNWRDEFAQVPTGGQGRVKEIKGRATVNGRTLALGDIVRSGETLRVAPSGHVIVSVQGGTIFNLRGEATLEFNASPGTTGLFRLAAGALLSVVPRGGRYLVQGPAATIGIKGTVSYRQVFREDEFEARATKGRTYSRPRNLTDYFCTCNGAVDYLRNEDRSLAASDQTGYHNAFFLDPAAGQMRNSAPLINHFDEDIDYLIGLQDGEKHDRSFLFKP